MRIHNICYIRQGRDVTLKARHSGLFSMPLYRVSDEVLGEELGEHSGIRGRRGVVTRGGVFEKEWGGDGGR